MTDKSEIVIRPMLLSDLASAFSLSKAEGWNQTEKDWTFLLTNPGNICLASSKKGKIVGTVTALVHSKKLAWIGMMIVDKELRGFGIGKQLMTSIIGKLSHIESVKLDATPAGLPLYKKLGFIEEYDLFRMINPEVTLTDNHLSPKKPFVMDSDGFTSLLNFDEKVFGCGRVSLLNYLFMNYPEKAFIIDKSGKTEGYILGRKGYRYEYIGPLIAYSQKSAVTLFKEGLRNLGKRPAAIDVPGIQKGFLNWLESVGFTKQRSFTRMYLGKNNYPGEIKNQYLISGPEFG